MFALLLLSGIVQANDMQKVIYPDGRVVWEQAPVASQVSTSSAKDCCEECGTSTCNGCKKGLNEPEIENGHACSTEDCEDIEVKMDGELERVCEETPFYTKCCPVEAHAPVPVIVCKKIETLQFKTHRVSSDPCCAFTVCVPCKKCWKTEKKCELRKTKAKLEVCLRQSGTVDVYVLNVPGMPTKWLWLQDAELESARQQIGKDFSF